MPKIDREPDGLFKKPRQIYYETAHSITKWTPYRLVISETICRSGRSGGN